MVLLRSLLAFASVAAVAICQDASTTTVDIQKLNEDTKKQWCTAQTSSCPLLCLQLPGASGDPTSNTCDSDTLVYSCICDNNQSPNSSEYSQTIPYFLCTEENNNCVAACGDSACQEQCRTGNPCGAQNPKLANTTSTNGSSTTTSATTSTTSTLAPFTGLPSDDDEGAAVRPVTDLRQVYGLAAVLGGFFAGFAILL
ncbi:hypothetical protein BDW74DRAFT_180691 [Aspergillus multicolor]|uniref:uncharacterized protein n=1 Tax=Aspergillus multicolor TaxID=41759 RepID=UPI003CCD1F52